MLTVSWRNMVTWRRRLFRIVSVFVQSLALNPMTPSPGPSRKLLKVLNIFRPAKFIGPLPIMIFIHGGAFQSGSNYDARLYNGTSFALLENIGCVANIRFNYGP